MLIWCLAMAPALAFAAPYAGYVMDARSGETLHSENADTPLHPASLTKMMTLYITFEAVQHGEITMDDYVTVSRNAAAEPPSKLGLRQGQKIKLRYLVRAAAIKSANDAATAIGEHIAGSEDAFAARMTRTARALGMSKTTFKNAHGLTLAGHLSTAHDMAILGRHMVYDYPQYYNLFSRISEDAGIRQVSNTNRRFLAAYKGADGIKTGYTNAAGFNLVASAQRGDTRIITVVFGGRSTASRNARVVELLDYGFSKAKKRVALNKPALPPYMGNKNLGNVFIAESANPDPEGARGKTIRVVAAAPTRSLRPQSRAGAKGADVAPLVASLEGDIETVLAAVQSAQPVVAQIVATDVAPEASAKPVRRPADLTGVQLASVGGGAGAVVSDAASTPEQEVVTRLSTSGGHHWGINVGRYGNKYEAEKVLLKTSLMESSTLDGSLRKVVGRGGGYDANFVGMTREMADLACRRLQARQVTCFMMGPSS
ncbi:D-alanyl-D-alanine carboxypeptidase family protein [Salipiger sp. 1_MG-2023]|uniref:D-alanyl-D-alanine carboxypeptidase family protein n=1 Tax=Salipiger sp. 1_MG-2023 TaxID=3062665 RepID=UPI0026E3790A|nr:D-alanyl-D-alanine carboxypeptidase family protein [Salipiger sp. 1_MG-2023]MDO6583993.1 D-alanyl-D-alanine carboxypeptidase family protein [Salipiger sp. 1_MG-2023]